MKIDENFSIGSGFPVFIIAEAGINHNGNIDIAREMIIKAKESGASAIKFQTFTTEDFVSNKAETYSYLSNGKQITESMFDMFKRHEFSREQWLQIIDCCKTNNILFLTTPQNQKDLDMMLSIIDLKMLKVGADDLTNLDLLKYYASKMIPMIISAGMAYISEIEDAILAIRGAGNNNITVLHCVSSYPASAEEVNLGKIKTIKEAFNVEVGFSDHTEGNIASIGAVALGASVIEKHFTLDKNMEGPDHWFSINPAELTELVNSIRFIEICMRGKEICPTGKEQDMRKLARRSIVAKRNIAAGEMILEDSICYKRPGTGIPPKDIKYILLRTAKNDIKQNELITLDKLI